MCAKSHFDVLRGTANFFYTLDLLSNFISVKTIKVRKPSEFGGESFLVNVTILKFRGRVQN